MGPCLPSGRRSLSISSTRSATMGGVQGALSSCTIRCSRVSACSRAAAGSASPTGA